jgi:E3 ubiquitin-protein ligase HECTD1
MQLQELISVKQSLLARSDLSEEAKADLIRELTVSIGGHEVHLEDLALTFEFSSPSASVFGYEAVELKAGGASMAVTVENVEEYVERTLDFALNKGIRRQMEALRAGFNLVFPMDKLNPFNPEEVRAMLCGDQCPVFTRDDIMRYTEPKLGYTKDSPGFLRFVNVLLGLTGPERKAFLQFTTGCSSLPPGKS